MIKGILFDLDGVLINSGEFHYQAWKIFYKKFNHTLTEEEFKKGFGKKNKDILEEFFKKPLSEELIEKYSNEKEEIFRKLAKGKIKCISGAEDLVKRLKEDNYLLGLVSSTPRINIDFVLKEIKLDKCFNTIISAEDVREGKPNPECYLKAAAELKLKPKECIVIEDSLAGIKAALAANMKCIAITTTQPYEKLTEATHIASSFLEIYNFIIKGGHNE